MSLSLITAFLTLSAFVVVVWIIAYFLKKYNPLNTNIILKNKNIKILNRLSLTPKSNLFIVTYEGKVKILGVTEQSITVIDSLQDLTDQENQTLIENQQIAQNIYAGLKQNFTEFIPKKD